MTIRHEVAELRRATGLDGSGCPECRDRKVVRLEWPGEGPMPGSHGDQGPADPVLCPVCGRDVRIVIRFVWEKHEGPRYPPWPEGRDA